ncbi:MAG: bifunctional adenosylcobinamide kinase/adenosylcobinamide-phosphate guanylyltransferase [Chloroflexi bacterium]|nr:bifunctional adenosylcobinamide kinase/adenosylcobinamide-phosphate guanylyltransferase [Chloroflexota bacterium]
MSETGRVVLVLGGARSGKSAFGEKLAARVAGPVWYVATAGPPRPDDPAMQARIAEHRQRRPAGWHTVEVVMTIATVLEERTAATGGALGAVLVDDLGLLATHHLLALSGDADPTRETVRLLDDILAVEIDALIASQRRGGWLLIVVSPEVGSGVIPPTPLGRAFQDGIGRANQRLAAYADEAFLVTAGLPLRLKPPCEHLRGQDGSATP